MTAWPEPITPMSLASSEIYTTTIPGWSGLSSSAMPGKAIRRSALAAPAPKDGAANTECEGNRMMRKQILPGARRPAARGW